MKIHFYHFVFFIFFLILFFPFTGVAQIIEVLSINDQKPISKVLIFNTDSSKNILTDIEGKADISTFNLDEKIYLTHIIFQSQQSTKQRLSKNKYQILQPSCQGIYLILIKVHFLSFLASWRVHKL